MTLDFRKSANKSSGFTIVEVLIVLAIVSVLAFLSTNMIRNSFRSKSREISWRMASTVRYLYNSAAMQNMTTRLVFDFESNSYWAEGTTEKFLLETGEKEEKKDEEEEAEGGVEPIEAVFGPMEASLIETKQLPAGIYLKDVYTSHDKEPITAGRAYIYFFQNGQAEEAVINFKNEPDEKHISVKINPFTGETDIAPEYRKLETK